MYYPVHMCAGYNNQAQRIALLANKQEKIFHTSDLAVFWKIKNKNTLYTTLKRYTKQKLIYRIFKGLYSLSPVDKLDPYLLGSKLINRFNYISTETVLFNEGIINQPPQYITYVGLKNSKYQVAEHNYLCRSMQQQFLFNDISLLEKNGLLVASKERAAADILYYNPKYYFDAKQLLDWEEIRKIQEAVGYA